MFSHVQVLAVPLLITSYSKYKDSEINGNIILVSNDSQKRENE
jgi:hypothetical protein